MWHRFCFLALKENSNIKALKYDKPNVFLSMCLFAFSFLNSFHSFYKLQMFETVISSTDILCPFQTLNLHRKLKKLTSQCTQNAKESIFEIWETTTHV